MTQDKQLLGISLEEVARKRELDQALNAKEFAVLTGISYSTSRSWFNTPGFPVIGRVVFWTDFLKWRQARSRPQEACCQSEQHPSDRSKTQTSPKWTGRAAKILNELS